MTTRFEELRPFQLSIQQCLLDALFEVETVEELEEEYADGLTEADIDELLGCADEMYPAKKDAKQQRYEENGTDERAWGRNPHVLSRSADN